MTHLTLSKRFTFEASHILPKHPGKCSRLHGHSWGLIVSVRGPIDPNTGFVLDYSQLKEVVTAHVINELDHRHLGQGFLTETSGKTIHPAWGANFYPSSENLVLAIKRVLEPLIPELRREVRLSGVIIEETCTSAAEWRLEDA